MGMGVTGALQWLGGAGTNEQLYGTKPIIPDFPTLNKAVSDSTASNRAMLPEYQSIAASVNTFNQAELLKMLKAAIPQFDEINQNASSLINSQLKGEIPVGVQNQVDLSASSRALSGGFGGSGMHGNLVARDLGLTSLDISNRALASADRWMAGAKSLQVPALYDATNMFINPMMSYNADIGTFQRDLMAAKVKAAPDPGKRGEFDSEMEFIGMVLSAYGGGSGYKGTYKKSSTDPDPGGGGTGPESGMGTGNGNDYVPMHYEDTASSWGGSGGSWNSGTSEEPKKKFSFF